MEVGLPVCEPGVLRVPRPKQNIHLVQTVNFILLTDSRYRKEKEVQLVKVMAGASERCIDMLYWYFPFYEAPCLCRDNVRLWCVRSTPVPSLSHINRLVTSGDD